jgi:signal transduction histidine kinase
MLNVTKSKRLKLVNTEIDFKSVIAESIYNLRNLDRAHKVEVKTTIETYLPFYNDRRQLAIIFNNIISNAIKFQHPHELHPTLVINIEIDENKALIVFKDNGIGIQKENISKIFDMFFRSPGSKADGAGLGLYITRELIKKLKGKITASSENREGAQFTVELPNKIDPDLLRRLNRLVQNTK